ncbi:MAG: hypothetical protein EBU97_05475, partial [Rhodobacteraceae bacterium]|nr:hypothetical protein [Paracoccaceae bacterium]
MSVTADVKAGVSPAEWNFTNSRIGGGSFYALAAGDGSSGASGGAGGSVTVNQTVLTRFDGGRGFDASGYNGDITVDALSFPTNGVSTNANVTLAATDTAALAGVARNLTKAVIGTGDIITAYGGQGGNSQNSSSGATAYDAGAGGAVSLNLQNMHTRSNVTLNVAGGLDIAAGAVNALSGAEQNDIRAMVGH